MITGSFYCKEQFFIWGARTLLSNKDLLPATFDTGKKKVKTKY